MRNILILLVSLFLVACGGGEGNDNPMSPSDNMGGSFSSPDGSGGSGASDSDNTGGDLSDTGGNSGSGGDTQSMGGEPADVCDCSYETTGLINAICEEGECLGCYRDASEDGRCESVYSPGTFAFGYSCDRPSLNPDTLLFDRGNEEGTVWCSTEDDL